MSNPIRVATAALSGRIFAGRPTKDGLGFKEPRYDVTSDVLQAIRDKVGIGNKVNVECGGVVEFVISVTPPDACAGMADPAAEIADLRAKLADAVGLLAQAREQLNDASAAVPSDEWRHAMQELVGRIDTATEGEI